MKIFRDGKWQYWVAIGFALFFFYIYQMAFYGKAEGATVTLPDDARTEVVTDTNDPFAPMALNNANDWSKWINLGGDPLVYGGIKGATTPAKRAYFKGVMRSMPKMKQALYKLGLNKAEVNGAMTAIAQGRFNICTLRYGERLAATTYGNPTRSKSKVIFLDPRYKNGAPAFCMTYKVKEGSRLVTVRLKIPFKCVNLSLVSKTSVTDVCPNTPAIDTRVPVGLRKDARGRCLPDVCPNVTGWQFTVPGGMQLNPANGKCLPDVCPNVTGWQFDLPAGTRINPTTGNCVTDACPNTTEFDWTVPQGMQVDPTTGNCVEDACPNTAEFDWTVPQGYFKNPAGNCIKINYDLDISKQANRKVVVLGNSLVFTVKVTNLSNVPVTIKATDPIRDWFHLKNAKIKGATVIKGVVTKTRRLNPGQSMLVQLPAVAHQFPAGRKPACNIARAVIVGTKVGGSARVCVRLKRPVKPKPTPKVTGSYIRPI